MTVFTGMGYVFASITGEKQIRVTEQVMSALRGEPVQSPVNALAIRMAAQREVQPYLALADRLGQIAGQLSPEHVRRVTVRCHGDVPRRYSELLTIAALRGVLARWVSEPVNLINAPYLAEEAGLAVKEERDTAVGSYTNLVEVDLETDGGSHRVAGTLFGAEEPRLVRVDDYLLEVRPEGRLLFYRNVDRPGMLAAVGSTLAEAGINIGALALGRIGKGSPALTAISVDDDIPEPVLQRVAALEGVEDVRLVTL